MFRSISLAIFYSSAVNFLCSGCGVARLVGVAGGLGALEEPADAAADALGDGAPDALN